MNRFQALARKALNSKSPEQVVALVEGFGRDMTKMQKNED
jgi:hypothetical protein